MPRGLTIDQTFEAVDPAVFELGTHLLGAWVSFGQIVPY